MITWPQPRVVEVKQASYYAIRQAQYSMYHTGYTWLYSSSCSELTTTLWSSKRKSRESALGGPLRRPPSAPSLSQGTGASSTIFMNKSHHRSTVGWWYHRECHFTSTTTSRTWAELHLILRLRKVPCRTRTVYYKFAMHSECQLSTHNILNARHMCE